MDLRACRADDSRIIRDQELVEFDYEEQGDYFLQLDVLDSYGNSQALKEKISLQEPESDL